ncbi:uncharacterized protein KZ484_010895 [Pholidichthys leucotaenia]
MMGMLCWRKATCEENKLVERQQDPESPSESGCVDGAEVDRHRESDDVDLKSVMEPRREDPDLSHVAEEEPLSLAPTVSSLGSSTSRQTRLGKQRRETNVDLLHYLERSDERQQEQSRRDEQITSSVLPSRSVPEWWHSW